MGQRQTMTPVCYSFSVSAMEREDPARSQQSCHQPPFEARDCVARLFAATRASPRDRAVFLLAYRHGLRASEVGLLRTDDIDFRALRIMLHRVKGSHSGAHPLQPDEVKALRAYLAQ